MSAALHPVHADFAASVSAFKANPMKVMSSAGGMPIAILNRSEPAFYCVPAPAFNAMMELMDDMALAKIIKSRRNEKPIPVSIDDL